MSGWQPHRDLARLLGSLDREILAAPDAEVRAAWMDDRCVMRAAAAEVRRLIADVVDEPDGDADASLPPVERNREHRVRQH